MIRSKRITDPGPVTRTWKSTTTIVEEKGKSIVIELEVERGGTRLVSLPKGQLEIYYDGNYHIQLPIWLYKDRNLGETESAPMKREVEWREILHYGEWLEEQTPHIGRKGEDHERN